jgi:dipeptidase
VDLTNKQKFLGSDNMHAIAKKHGWWKESDGHLDFTKCFSDGEYAHKFYSGRRMWGAYHIWGNDLADNYTNLKYEDDVYPTTMVPAHKTDQQELMQIHRYYYQGTKYDMTKGIAAGAFGNPDRYSGNENSKVKGHWERSIGLFRTSETHLVQAHAKLARQVCIYTGIIYHISYISYRCGATV